MRWIWRVNHIRALPSAPNAEYSFKTIIVFAIRRERHYMAYKP